MANGDIVSVTVLADGWNADVAIAGLLTGGTYDFGLGANNDPTTGTPKVVFTVTRLGFDATGSATTVVDTVYGQVKVQKPYPNATTTEETTGGGNVTVRIALSEPIYAKDKTGGGNSGTDPTVTILASFYTQGGTPNNATTGLTVVNNSTLAYPKIVGNWSIPGYEKCGATQNLRCVAFHKFARAGLQVKCVKFTIADTHSHTDTVTVTVPTIDSTFGDQVPVVEYSATMNTSGFTQNDIVTANFIAYPHIGDSAACLDTSAGTTPPTPLYGPQKYIADPNGTYNTNFAVVDPTSGNDTTGVAGSLVAAAAAPCASIGGAFNKIRINSNAGTNVSAARNNCGGATIYLKDNAGGVNNFQWMGATTPTIGTDPSCRLLIAIYPGNTRSNVVINSANAGTSNHNAGKMYRIQGVKITAQLASGVFDGGFTAGGDEDVVFDSCEFDSSANLTLYRNEVFHLLRNTITTLAQGIKPFSNVNMAPSIIRGNAINATTFDGSVFSYTFIGNSKTNTTNVNFIDDSSVGTGCPTLTNQVFAFNRWTGTSSGSPLLRLRASSAENHGIAIVQNIIEQTGASQPTAQVAGDASSTVCNNVIIHHNVFVGQRANLAYNEYGAIGLARNNWSVKNNLFDDFNIKSDTYNGTSATATRSYGAGSCTVTVTQSAHQYQNGDTVVIASGNVNPSGYVGSFTVASATANTFQFTFAVGADPGAIISLTIAPNGGRIGNWPLMFGCGCSGNVLAETTGIGAPGSFMPNMTGLKSISATITGQPPASSPTNATTYLAFVDRKAYDGSSPGAGNGDYRIRSTSPAWGTVFDSLLLYDFAGIARRDKDSAGAYATGVWRQQNQIRDGAAIGGLIKSGACL